MKFYIETERLILRDLLPADEEGMFEMESAPEVYRYLEGEPLTAIEQVRDVIAFIRQQYEDRGIGRWAVLEKSSGNFLGWSGLKLNTTPENNHVNFYDVGYRFIPKYWGKGYATESAMAALKYGFETMKLDEIAGSCYQGNKASRNVLEKCGLKFIEQYQWKGITCNWLTISRQDWLSGK